MICKSPIVGLDLCGNEDGFPAKDHREAFMHAHQYFMRVRFTREKHIMQKHFEALTHIHADRIGHGYFIFDEKKLDREEKERFLKEINMKSADFIDGLVNYISERRLTIEVSYLRIFKHNPSKYLKIIPFGKC